MFKSFFVNKQIYTAYIVDIEAFEEHGMALQWCDKSRDGDQAER